MIDDLNHRHDVRLVLDGRHWTMGGTMQHSVVSSQVVNGHYTDGEAIEDELSVPHEYVRIQKK